LDRPPGPYDFEFYTSGPGQADDCGMSNKDNSSQSNPDEVKSEHLHLKLAVDFNLTVMTGSVEFSVVASKGAKCFVLDTKDLSISSVKVDGKETAYSLGTKHEIFGSALSIPLPSSTTSAGGKCSVIVNYSTSPQSSACQWLPPAQTAGKRYPFLFTQCQAIHARSLLPCQDCPKAKCTWSCEISAPSWATVLMSALQEGNPGNISLVSSIIRPKLYISLSKRD
jgi:leukotriene-A4 hydrolase